MQKQIRMKKRQIALLEKENRDKAVCFSNMLKLTNMILGL